MIAYSTVKRMFLLQLLKNKPKPPCFIAVRHYTLTSFLADILTIRPLLCFLVQNQTECTVCLHLFSYRRDKKKVAVADLNTRRVSNISNFPFISTTGINQTCHLASPISSADLWNEEGDHDSSVHIGGPVKAQRKLAD